MSLIVFLSYIVDPFVRFAVRPKVKGRENIAGEKPAVVCVNHLSNWDAVVLNGTLKLDSRYLVKKSLMSKPLLGGFLKKLKVIPVDRDAKDFSALRSSISAAKNGDTVVIFPQGTRVVGEPPRAEQAKKGVSLIVASAGAPVVPVGLYTKDYKFRWFRRYCVNVGKPITPEEYRPILETGDKADRFERMTEYVFGRTAQLAKEAEQWK